MVCTPTRTTPFSPTYYGRQTLKSECIIESGLQWSRKEGGGTPEEIALRISIWYGSKSVGFSCGSKYPNETEVHTTLPKNEREKKVICLAAEILWRDENFIICHGWSGWFPFGQLTVESVVMVLVEPRRMIWDSTNIIVFYSWMPEQHPVGWLHHHRIRIESFGWVWAFPLSG